eukprot:scaffold30374_cov107-Isochrysis_galbana.AAC.3
MSRIWLTVPFLTVADRRGGSNETGAPAGGGTVISTTSPCAYPSPPSSRRTARHRPAGRVTARATAGRPVFPGGRSNVTAMPAAPTPAISPSRSTTVTRPASASPRSALMASVGWDVRSSSEKSWASARSRSGCAGAAAYRDRNRDKSCSLPRGPRNCSRPSSTEAMRER